MSARGLERPLERFDKLKKLGSLAIAAAVVAVVLVLVLRFLGVVDALPLTPIFILGFVITPTWTVFLAIFALVATTILVVVTYGKAIKIALGKAVTFLLGLPQRIKAILLGLEVGLIAGLSAYVIDVYRYSYPEFTPVVVGTLAWIGASVLTLHLLGRGWMLSEWAKAVNTGALLGGVIAIMVAFVFVGVDPGYGANLVFLLTWAAVAYAMARRTHAMEDSVWTRMLVRTGYAQMRQVDALTVSVLTGLVVGLLVATLVGLAGSAPTGPFRRAILALAIVWPSIAVAVLWGWPSHERTDLVIEDIRLRRLTEDRELTVRNLGDEPVDLANAKLKDAENTLFAANTSISLGAGQTGELYIPSEFTLDASGRYELLKLPFGVWLERDATDPTVITRDGKTFTLLWADQIYEQEQSAAADQPRAEPA